MSNIYDDKVEVRSTKEIAHRLFSFYSEYLASQHANVDIDVRMRRTNLAMHWPGDELVRQIIFDAAQIMSSNGVDVDSIKW